METINLITEVVSRPEHALKLFVRFAIAKGVVTYGLELMVALFDIAQGMLSTVMKAAGVGATKGMSLPKKTGQRSERSERRRREGAVHFYQK